MHEASATTGTHIDCLVVSSIAQLRGIWHHVAQGQIVSADLL